MSAYDDYMAAQEEYERLMYGQFENKKKKKRRYTPPATPRKVRYVEPGHTRVTYAHRVLDINFKETKKEFDARQRARKKVLAKKRKIKGQEVYMTEDGRYVNGNGRDVTARVLREMESYETERRHKALNTDRYTIEDMRALLRDDRWEEVCGHKRWNYDKNSTVKEFKKYLARHKGKY